MKAEIQALEQALSEVVTGRQRLDAAADLIRNSLAVLRQAELAAERAAMAAAAAQDIIEQAAREQAARELAEKDAAAARAKEITQQFATVMDVVTKLAQGYFDGLRKDREAERLREEKQREAERLREEKRQQRDEERLRDEERRRDEVMLTDLRGTLERLLLRSERPARAAEAPKTARPNGQS
jgi:hypothetical protein